MRYKQFLYMVTMTPPIPVQFVVSHLVSFKDTCLYFPGIKEGQDYYANPEYRQHTWKRINNNHWVDIECLGQCDEDGKLIES